MTVIPPADDLIYDSAAKLLASLTVEVQKLANVPKNIGFLPGTQVAEDISVYSDICCEGTAYVRHASTYPSGENWPAPDTGQNPCSPIAWGTVFEIGIMRCAPSGGVNFGPSFADWDQANSQYFIDMAALRATVCTYRNTWSSGPYDAGVLIGQVVPLGPAGGCIVASLNVTVQNLPYATCPDC